MDTWSDLQFSVASATRVAHSNFIFNIAELPKAQEQDAVFDSMHRVPYKSRLKELPYTEMHPTFPK